MQKSRIIYVKLILTMAIWSGTFVVGRIIAQNMSRFAIGVSRCALASPFFAEV